MRCVTVEERSWGGEAQSVRTGGAPRSENVGMSNELGRREIGPPNIQGFLGNVNRPRVSRS